MCSTGLSRYRLDTRALSVAEDFSLHTGLGADKCNSQGVCNESSAT